MPRHTDVLRTGGRVKDGRRVMENKPRSQKAAQKWTPQNPTGLSAQERDNSMSLWVVEHWDRLPRGAGESPFPDMLKTHPGTILLWVTLCFSRGWLDKLISRGAFQPQPLPDPTAHTA